MVKMILPCVAFLACGLIVSCSDINFTEKGYKNALRSGMKKIPEARQMDEMFTQVDHSIAYHGDRSVGNDWSTEVFFHGRYVLTMQVSVKMGYQFNKVLKVIGEPKFYLFEVKSVENYDGQIGASFAGDGQRTFNAAEWKRSIKQKEIFLSLVSICRKNNLL